MCNSNAFLNRMWSQWLSSEDDGLDQPVFSVMFCNVTKHKIDLWNAAREGKSTSSGTSSTLASPSTSALGAECVLSNQGQTWKIYLFRLKNIIDHSVFRREYLSQRTSYELYHSQDPGTISIFHLINSETFGSWARISVCQDLHEAMLRNELRRAEKIGDLKILKLL